MCLLTHALICRAPIEVKRYFARQRSILRGNRHRAKPRWGDRFREPVQKTKAASPGRAGRSGLKALLRRSRYFCGAGCGSGAVGFSAAVVLESAEIAPIGVVAVFGFTSRVR